VSVGSLGMLSALPYRTRELLEIAVLMLGCHTVNPGSVSRAEYPITESDLGNLGRSMPDFMGFAGQPSR